MRYERTITIDADIRTTWAVMIDVAQWPGWTDSVVAAEMETPGPITGGSKVRLHLAGSPAANWIVTEFSPFRAFTWEMRARGVKATAWHVIEPQERGVRVRLSVDFSGPGARIFRPLIARTTRRNLELEANGLKERVESLAVAIAA